MYTEFDFLAVLDDSQETAVDCRGCVEAEKLPFNLNAQKTYNDMSQLMRLWYLSYRRPAKAYIKYASRRRV